jgi:cation diffusion facilitator family transporter
MSEFTKRTKTGIKLTVVAITSNVILSILKFIIGIIGSSIALISDAINNLVDTGASIVTLIGFKLSTKPADSKHPFGHARYEYISGFLTAILIIIVGAVLGKTSFDRIIQPVALNINSFTYIVLIISLLVKAGLAIYYGVESKRLKSTTLKIAMFDSINDTLTTIACLLAVLLFGIFQLNLDGVFGLFVACWMVFSGIKLFLVGLSPLIGHGDSETIQILNKKILSYQNVLGVHDILIHNYGPSTKYASAHVEISPETSLTSAHRLIDRIEREIKNQLNIYISIHIDPLEQCNPKIIEVEAKLTKSLSFLDKEITIHDLHIDECECLICVYFDVTLPYQSKLTKEVIINAAQSALANDTINYSFIIDIDRC